MDSNDARALTPEQRRTFREQLRIEHERIAAATPVLEGLLTKYHEDEQLLRQLLAERN